MAKKKDLICFDLDGTLIDSTEAHVQSYLRAFKQNKLLTPSKKKLLSMFGVGVEEIISELFPELTPRKLKVVVQSHMDAHKASKKLVKQIPHAVEALLKLKPHFRLGIVTNNHHDGALELLEYAKVPAKLFDVIIGSDEARPKPSASEILLAEKLTNANAKYMVGDTIYDIKAGKRANCKTIGVLTGMHNMDQLMKAKADMLVSSLRIVPDLLLKK
ncbi:HAD family hydrolase [Candidatus Woesearchaeota archaeon]|jgi:phosphoglycolate phosphatase-like HAD superfamily hydrolase|nr:HAD family hydrolase [Candidatus Woesearchaeota archaeon]MBT4114662.1 HAD family hydrolase [Candidatus Woesearchaeota archaeon]MBT4248354.1 HAD family hydrolase [Candidatus Woesearchaeota archaeon]